MEVALVTVYKLLQHMYIDHHYSETLITNNTRQARAARMKSRERLSRIRLMCGKHRTISPLAMRGAISISRTRLRLVEHVL